MSITTPTTTPAASRATRARLLLYASIFIAMIAYGMTLPLFPFLLESFGGRGLHMGLLVAAYGVMQLLCAPIWGRMSDRTGRKPMLLLGMSGLTASLLVFAFARHLPMLYLGQLLMGGLTSALFPVASAYITDVTDDDARAGALGRIGAATGLGIVVGPGLGGLLALDSLSRPFFISAAAALLVCAFLLIVLPESLHQRTTTHGGDPRFGLVAAARALRGPIGIGLFLLFAVYFGKSNLSGVFSLFAMEKFAYGTTEIGGLLMIMGLGYALVQGIAVGPLTRRFGDNAMITACTAGSALGFLALLFAPHFVALAAALCLFIACNAGLKPTVLSWISRNATMGHGSVMGYADVFMSSGRILGPLWAGALFDLNVAYPFISGSVFFAAVFLGLVLKPGAVLSTSPGTRRRFS